MHRSKNKNVRTGMIWYTIFRVFCLPDAFPPESKYSEVKMAYA
jgi:hypothetical protein